MVTKVFSVADLVTPVPNFALPEYVNFDKMLNRNALNSGNLVIQGLNAGGGATPRIPRGGLMGGETASSELPGRFASSPGVQSPGFSGGRGGTLETSPLSGSSSVTESNNTKHEQLIKLITSMVRPYSWDGHGGAGRIEYFDIGSALVVNQTADVIAEVADLLEALRRLQDLAVAVEIRIVSLSESFFERIGVDFSMNIKTNTYQLRAGTHHAGRSGRSRSSTTSTVKGVTVGLTPAGTFTPRPGRADPGDQLRPRHSARSAAIRTLRATTAASRSASRSSTTSRCTCSWKPPRATAASNVMQAPKLTLFNGQTATMSVSDHQFFVTNVSGGSR